MKRFVFDKSSFFLTLIFIVATALIFFLMGLTYKHLEKLSNSSQKFTHTYEVSLKLEALYSGLKDIETERRNYILTKDEESKKTVNKRIYESKILLKELYHLSEDNPEQLENLNTLSDMVKYKHKIARQTFAENFDENSSPQDMKLYLLAGKNVMASIHDQIEKMLSIERDLLEKRKNDYLFSQKSTPFYLYIISVFSLGLLGFAFYKINSDVKRQKQINRDLQLALDSSNLAEQVGSYGIWIYNFANDEYTFSDNEYRLLGYAPQSFKAGYDIFLKHIHPEDLEMVNRKSQQMLEGETQNFTYRLIRKDGVLRHFQATARKVETITGESVLLGITKDVTHDIENQMKLESINWILIEKNKNLKITNETYTEAEKIGLFGTWQWFIEEKRFNFSDNLIRLFGFEPSDFEHELKSFLVAIHPDDVDMVKEKAEMMYNREFVPPFYHRLYKQDTGELRYVSITSKIISDQDVGEYYLVITEDITDEMLAQQDILEKNRTLEANNQELQAFNYVASHDLQEPLRKIETFISRLRDKDFDKLSDSGKQYMDRMENSAGRMRKLIDDLLQFSRTTRSEQVYEKTNLNFLLEQSIDSLSQQIQDKNAKITADKLPVLKVIPFQIQQLLTNLISNSLKYSKEDVAPEINISVKKIKAEDEDQLPKELGNNYYKFVFSDNGIGFEQEYAEKIFQLFSRLHGKNEYAGTGIGLAICKKIIENHKGFIFAEGTPEIGSTFTVYLPAEA